ncbi:MAG: NUDIX hydrolase [Magnetospirillum sp. WYHS-4]
MTDNDGIIEILTDPGEAEVARQASAARLVAAGHPADYAALGLREENQFWRVIRDPVRFPDGHVGTYHRVVVRPEYLPAVSALPLLGDKIVLIRIFRHPLRAFLLETPRGFGTPGLSPEEGARLELEEEIGAKITEMIDLGQAYLSSGLSDEVAAFFLARLESVGLPEKAEAIRDILTVSVPEFEAMASDGRITDSFTLIAFLRARLKGLL